ncbi:MAG TPA: prolipoprotein diacylglyceryl transferase [Candidatus Limnocylindrales bacterium]
MPSLLLPVLAMIAITPDPIAFHLGPVPVYWYGVCYALGLAASYVVVTREAQRRGLDARLVDNGIIIVAAAALAGGRAYHVIDQWALYKDDPIRIFLPPYTGLGVYGGILTGTIAAVYIIHRWKQPFWKWADVIAPGLFVMQAIGRWGNYFNQELYGPPTNLPWGIAIDCTHRVSDHGIVQWPCSQYPFETTAFTPLFLYESISGLLGAAVLLWIARRWGAKMRPGDLLLVWFMWYAAVRFWLETFREGNWTFFGVPMAMLVSAIVFLLAGTMLVFRHRPDAVFEPWGEPPTPEDELYDEADEDEALEDDEVLADDGADDADEADDQADADDEEDLDDEVDHAASQRSAAQAEADPAS